MRSTATIMLLFLLVSAQTPVGQVLKLPLLVEHFLKHQEQEGASLIGFLDEHYISDHQDADLPEDEQLPFKSLAHYSIGSAIVPELAETKLPVHIPPGKKPVIPQISIPQQHLPGIFHPPRA